MKFIYSIGLSLLFFLGHGQEALSVNHLEKEAFRFSLGEEHIIEGRAREVISDLVREHQFVGLAEVHQSQQLSFFTTGLLELLKESGFNHFALEIGPNSAKILQQISKEPGSAKTEIKRLNNLYGKKSSFFRVPIMFVDKIEDALFIDKASQLGFSFWGLDQEFSKSFEMNLDDIYKLTESPNSETETLYKKTKGLIRKNIFKKKVSGESIYCWYLKNNTIQEFLDLYDDNQEASWIIWQMQISWDIYCKSATGKGSNQQRANYMKSNFDSLYQIASKKEDLPKVFVKLGGVHLTHGTSPFRVNDIGKFLHEKATANQSSFLSIRHLVTYRNGRSNIGRSGWENLDMFLELGRKDQWTLVDLRPFRERVMNGELTTTVSYKFELNSYDLLLIPPNDQISKLNY